MSTPQSYTFEASDADFQAAVLEKSHQVPVLVDFWAPWCGPCQVLGPVLEKLAVEGQGRFHLVKVNMDTSPMLAQLLRIQSIPAVKLFINGELRGEFMGAYPEPEIRRFLDQRLPSEAHHEAVDALHELDRGGADAAVQRLQAALARDPKDPAALIGLGMYHLQQGELAQAREMAERVSEVAVDQSAAVNGVKPRLAALRAGIFLSENAGDPAQAQARLAEREDDLDARFALGCTLALAGDFEAALEHLLYVVRRDRKAHDDGGRKGMLAVFDLLPPDSPLAQTYRNRLSSILFS